jgi:hypothetical protein
MTLWCCWDQVQCCTDYIEAAQAGHVDCLSRLTEEGNFHPFVPRRRNPEEDPQAPQPEARKAGEARRAQPWWAALAACNAGHADVLAELLKEGWPSMAHSLYQCHELEVAEDWGVITGGRLRPSPEDLALVEKIKEHRNDLREDAPLCRACRCRACGGLSTDHLGFLPEVLLYLSAVRNPSSACLEVLLQAGCRSEVLCSAAIHVGRPDLLVLANDRGCPCILDDLPVAAEKGNLALLEAVHHRAIPVLEALKLSALDQEAVPHSEGETHEEGVVSYLMKPKKMDPGNPLIHFSYRLEREGSEPFKHIT